MENGIIIAILVVLIGVGLRSGIKHMKGQGACCGGGGSVKPKKKKLQHVIARKTIIVEGMTCEHCKNRVEMCINELDGAAAKVNLKKKEAVVSLEKEISEDEIRAAIEKAGYEVTTIR